MLALISLNSQHNCDLDDKYYFSFINYINCTWKYIKRGFKTKSR